ncbi:hypothetical protein [Melittangium boletus]|uniref:hypothetical protein n=1 Tax=Melittangium boletus TaxID=83453 RepID=UPI0012FE44C2|nr:hypothetical protein [Melittangium boletus]
MSPAPIRDEQLSSTEAQADPETPAPSRTRDLMSVAAGAVATIAARTLGFGVLGFVLGTAAFFVERATGVLTHPWEPWRYLVYVLLLAYMAAGVVGLGGAGMWRGIGRVAMDLVEKHQLSQQLVDRVMDRAAVLAAGEATPEVFHRPLPIQKLRELIHQASGADPESEETEKKLRRLSGAIIRRVRRGVAGIIEARLDDIIGEQERDASTVELTLGRLRELAGEQLDERVMDALDGARNKQALLWAALFVGTVALPPLVLTLLR